MNESRRDFMKKAALLAGGAGFIGTLPPAIQKALAIDPEKGSTFYDAEHVVFLMQENRSFDHCFGTLKGVRGFNDPRAIRLPNKNLVWMQSDKEGNTYAPFRLNIKDTKATWMGGMPHSWENQVDARNGGKYDQWLEAKRPGNQEFADMPLTMGYYTREDIPFYYALADAFTVCDQHFCSSLTGTTTNRNFFWTGKTHGPAGEKPKVRNSDIGYTKEIDWTTFPERLEENGISWRIYQNELSIPSGLEGEAESLLANFTDNNLEWFSQYHVRFSPAHYEYLKKLEREVTRKLDVLPKGAGTASEKERIALDKELEEIKAALHRADPARFETLSEFQKKLHKRAFTTNSGDPNYRETSTLKYTEEGEERKTEIPKGDILYQFRKDVKEGKLPTVSWLVAPQKYSDHPSAPWYGAWYVSEVLDILTKNPEVWKETIFILNYDENDGYFDHVPPFVPPKPGDPNAGKISDGLNVAGEFVTKEEELEAGYPERYARESPVGLGYRVPLVIASPWTRGGWVNSEVLDLTSSLRFLETWLEKKTGKPIKETNISSWRRAITGDMSSVFRPYNGEQIGLPEMLEKDEHTKAINNAKFKDLPKGYHLISPEEADFANNNPERAVFLPRQEGGTKPSCGLKYELYADGKVSKLANAFELEMIAGDAYFGKQALGSPFNVYASEEYRTEGKGKAEVNTWAFAVKAGDSLNYQWPLKGFVDGVYHLELYGPNGFYRKYQGNQTDPDIQVSCQYVFKKGRISEPELELVVTNNHDSTLKVVISDNAYGKESKQLLCPSGKQSKISFKLGDSFGWYDLTLKVEGQEVFERRWAGRVENGQNSQSDPFMGRI